MAAVKRALERAGKSGTSTRIDFFSQFWAFLKADCVNNVWWKAVPHLVRISGPLRRNKMFNLITVIFGIVLVLVLGIAGLYYGGETIASKKLDTTYVELSNKANQIKGAMEIYRARTGTYPAAADAEALFSILITEGYLTSEPELGDGGSWVVDNTSALTIQREIEDARTCSRVNELAGFDIANVLDGTGCPACNEAEYAIWPGCKVVN
jgi:hypothetical protein